MTTIFFFVKFCEREEHAKAFVDGRLFLQPLQNFKAMEERDDGRGDRYEAPSAWFAPSSLSHVQLGPHRIDAGQLAGPLVMQPSDANLLNVMCLYAAMDHPFVEGQVVSDDEVREHFRVPKQCLNMGRFAVLVHEPKLFCERFDAAIRREGFGLIRGPVEYFDPDTFSGKFDRPLFAKQKRFAWQREYRLAVKRRISAAEVYTLNVGSLKDACTVFDSATLNEQVTVGLNATA
jgi:hypothetical protein